jgi:hypothetical protein
VPEPAVDEKAPYVAEGHLAGEIFEIDTAVSQRAAVAVRLGDFGPEGDDAFQPRAESVVGCLTGRYGS